MKILHVINYLSDGGGAEKLMEDLLPALKSKGVDVSIAVLRKMETINSQHLYRQGIQIINIGTKGSLYSPIKMLKLIAIMRQYDIIHSHLNAPFLFCAFNSWFCKAKLVHTVHNTDSKFRHYPFLRNIEKWAMNKYNIIIACSFEAEISLRSFLGRKNKKKIITINNGVRLDKFLEAIPPNKIKDEKKIIITMVAVFRPQKDHKTLIKATQLLPNMYHTYLVGYGSLLEDMKEYARSLKINDRVHFLGKRTDVPQILKSSDYIVLSSHYEGLSLSAIEGMAAGRPFIASNVPGLKELVNGYGILFEEGNAEQLSKIILSLSNDGNLYQETAKKCMNRALSYDINKMADLYINIYKTL